MPIGIQAAGIRRMVRQLTSSGHLRPGGSNLFNSALCAFRLAVPPATRGAIRSGLANGGRFGAQSSDMQKSKNGTMYSAKTNGIKIDVEPIYLEDKSDPVESRYFWAYSIDIRNEREDSVQLLSRHWVITDGTGMREEVRGPGVIGKQPVIEPGQSFSYTSGCPLTTPSGIMAGTYQMTNSDGESFSVNIPAFSLDLPNQSRVIN